MLSIEDARRLGIQNRDEVELSTGGDRVSATVVVRTGVPAGSVFLSSSALADGPVEITVGQAVPG